MNRVLFDSSALFKRYNRELGREQVLAIGDKADAVVVAAHCLTELASALNRQRHDGVLNEEDYGGIMAIMREEFAEFAVIPLDRRVEGFALQAMQRVRLPAMDALHIGTAQAAYVDMFVTADRRQAQAARAAGLTTELIEA